MGLFFLYIHTRPMYVYMPEHWTFDEEILTSPRVYDYKDASAFLLTPGHSMSGSDARTRLIPLPRQERNNHVIDEWTASFQNLLLLSDFIHYRMKENCLCKPTILHFIASPNTIPVLYFFLDDEIPLNFKPKSLKRNSVTSTAYENMGRKHCFSFYK